MGFPVTRMRRMRRNETLRSMVRENRLAREDRMTAEQKYRYNFDKWVFSQSRTFWEKDRIKKITEV